MMMQRNFSSMSIIFAALSCTGRYRRNYHTPPSTASRHLRYRRVGGWYRSTGQRPRSNYTVSELRVSVEEKRFCTVQRMLGLAMVLEGAKRSDAARLAGMDRQTLQRSPPR